LLFSLEDQEMRIRTLRFVNRRSVNQMSFYFGLGFFLMLVLFSLQSASASATISAAKPLAPRLQAEISSSSASTLKGSLHPLAQAQYDSGRVPADTRLNGMSIVFNRSAAQQADLEALIAAQQNPSSPLYLQWLNPDQFAARFGMAPSDLNKVQAWLEQQGFSVDSVARSRNMIRFSGSVGRLEQAFQTQMHFYTIAGEKHFAPSTALMLPSALTPVVMAVRNLDDFRPKPMIEKSRKIQANPAFTSSASGSVFFAPGDIKLAYGVNTLISAGSTGAGQSIAIAGQSSILNSDIENFENASGLAVKDPNQVLVPGSGSSQTFAGDEGESDLDVEWSGGIAPGAEIFFIYTGSSTNYGVFDSITYAVDEKIGNIISISYGSCEPEMSAGSASALDLVLAQAATQGQTLVAASGDSGSSACYQGVPTTQNGLPPLTTQEELAVSYPASSEYATGVGGTEITAADDVSTNSTYWEGQGTSDEVTSLLEYIPEVAWNDDATAVAAGATTLSATGGGASTLYTTKPSWQTGVPGIPSDGKRDVPDVAFYASPDLPGYLYCTSDTSDWTTSQQASCNSGFRDSATQDLTVAGGTSFATPIFAGMVAVLNQARGYGAGQGLINPTLYTLASNATTYAAAFHDVTTGNNECPSSLPSASSYCSTASEGSYTTTTGYDQVTGLGSVNLSALVTAWPLSTATLIGTTTAVTAASATPAVSTNDTITITVASDSPSTTIPTGNVTLSIDGCGTSYGTTGCTPQMVALAANGTAIYTANFGTAGVHNIVAQYLGDSTHLPSTGSVSVSIAGSSSGKGTFAFTPPPTNVTVAQGSSASSTITVTPAGGYTGTVDLNFDTSNDTALSNLCYQFGTQLTSGGGSVAITGTSAVTTTLNFDTNASDCASAAIAKGGKKPMHRLGPVKTSQNNAPSRVPLAVAFAGLLLAGFMGRSSRKLRSLAAVIGLLAIGLGLSACGSSSSSTTVSNPPKGTYTITVTGQDSTTATIAATPITFTLVID
jgi:subtilase family serine protease